MNKILNSLMFGWAAFFSAMIGLLACVLILIKEKFQFEEHARNRTGVFLKDKRRALSFYRVFSKVYDRLNVFFYTETMRNAVVDLAGLSKGSRVLDVGCGTGYTTEAVLRKLERGEVVGIDVTPQQLSRAAMKLEFWSSKLFLSRGDAENLPFEDEVFDAVVSVGALEYFPNPRKAVQEMARVVKLGGKVVVGGPEVDWFRKISLDRMLYTPSAKEVEGSFSQAGLKDIRSVLTGVDTFFDTNKYVVIVVGTK